MEKRVEGSERISGPLKSTALFPERALPVDALLISYCLLQLPSHARLSGEAGGSGLEGGFQASRAECAVSSQKQGLATAEGHCAVPGWGGEGRQEVAPSERVFLPPLLCRRLSHCSQPSHAIAQRTTAATWSTQLYLTGAGGVQTFQRPLEAFGQGINTGLLPGCNETSPSPRQQEFLYPLRLDSEGLDRSCSSDLSHLPASLPLSFHFFSSRFCQPAPLIPDSPLQQLQCSTSCLHLALLAGWFFPSTAFAGASAW